MLLSVDIGNSHTVMGAWQEDELISSCRVTSYVMQGNDQKQERSVLAWQELIDEWLKKVQEKNIPVKETFKNKASGETQNNSGADENSLEVVFSCVAKTVCENFQQAMQNITSNVMRVQWNKKLPFVFDYQGANTLGEDRIANAVAATSYFGENNIIVDFGSAVTFCLVTKNVYRGGIILPGIVTSLNALNQNTSLPSTRFALQKNILGKTTEQAMEKGIFFAYKGAVKELLIRLKEQARQWVDEQDIAIIATGGIAEHLGFSHEFFDAVDTNLTLRGLYQYYLLNK